MLPNDVAKTVLGKGKRKRGVGGACRCECARVCTCAKSSPNTQKITNVRDICIGIFFIHEEVITRGKKNNTKKGRAWGMVISGEKNSEGVRGRAGDKFFDSLQIIFKVNL